MAQVVYLGDETTAAGYRLAGVETLVPAATEAAAELRRLEAADVDLVLLAGSLASHVPAAQLALALSRDRPLLTIVPDVYGAGGAVDLAHEVRAALGIEP